MEFSTWAPPTFTESRLTFFFKKNRHGKLCEPYKLPYFRDCRQACCIFASLAACISPCRGFAWVPFSVPWMLGVQVVSTDVRWAFTFLLALVKESRQDLMHVWREKKYVWQDVSVFFWLYLDASEMSRSWSLCRRPGLELVSGIILLSSSMRLVCLQEASGHTSPVIFQSFRHLWCLSLPCFLPGQPNVASWGLKCLSLMKAFLFKYRGEIKNFV